MLDNVLLSYLCEFSRNNCVALCAFLVPANLLAASTTLLLRIMGRGAISVLSASAVGGLLAVAMFLHVATWLIIGVVMPATFTNLFID